MEPVSRLKLEYPIYALNVLPDNAIVVTGGGGRLKSGVPNACDLISVDESSQTLKPLASVTLPDAGAALATWGRSIYVAIDSGIKTFFYKSAGFLKPASRFHHDVRVSATMEQTAVDISADGKILALAADDGSVVVLSMPRYKILFKGAIHSDGITNLNLSHDGRLACTTAHDRQALVWDTRSGAIVQSIAPTSISPKSEPTNTTSARRAPPRSHVRALRLSTAGTLLYAAESGHIGGFVSVWRATGTAPAFSTAAFMRVTSEAVTGLAVDDSGMTAAVATSEGHICILRFDGHTNLSVLWRTDRTFFKRGVTPHVLPITGMCFTHRGTRLVTASADSSVALWNFERQSSHRLLIWLLIAIILAVFALCTSWLSLPAASSRRHAFSIQPRVTQAPGTDAWEYAPQSNWHRFQPWQFWVPDSRSDICLSSGEEAMGPTSHEIFVSSPIAEHTLKEAARQMPVHFSGAGKEPSTSPPRHRKNRRKSETDFALSSSHQSHRPRLTESARQSVELGMHKNPAHDLKTERSMESKDEQRGACHRPTLEESANSQQSIVHGLEPEVTGIVTGEKGPTETSSHDTFMTQNPRKPVEERPPSATSNARNENGKNVETNRYHKQRHNVQETILEVESDPDCRSRPGSEKCSSSYSRKNPAKSPEVTFIQPGKRQHQRKVSASSKVQAGPISANAEISGGDMVDLDVLTLNELNENYKKVEQATFQKSVKPRFSNSDTASIIGQKPSEHTMVDDVHPKNNLRPTEEAKEFQTDGSPSCATSNMNTAEETQPKLSLTKEATKTDRKAAHKKRSRRSNSAIHEHDAIRSTGERAPAVDKSTNTNLLKFPKYLKKRANSFRSSSHFCKPSYPSFIIAKHRTFRATDRPRDNEGSIQSQLFPLVTSQLGPVRDGALGGHRDLENEQPSRGKPTPNTEYLESLIGRETGNEENSQDIQNAIAVMLASLDSDPLKITNSRDVEDPDGSRMRPSDMMSHFVGKIKPSLVRLGIVSEDRCPKDNLRSNRKYWTSRCGKGSFPAFEVASSKSSTATPTSAIVTDEFRSPLPVPNTSPLERRGAAPGLIEDGAEMHTGSIESGDVETATSRNEYCRNSVTDNCRRRHPFFIGIQGQSASDPHQLAQMDGGPTSESDEHRNGSGRVEPAITPRDVPAGFDEKGRTVAEGKSLGEQHRHSRSAKIRVKKKVLGSQRQCQNTNNVLSAD